MTCPDVNGGKQGCKDNGNNTSTCVPICDITPCSAPLVCFPPTGECLPDDCTTYPDRCSANENCIGGQCIANPCIDVVCPSDQYCASGTCHESCAGVTCPDGQRCRLGACEPDPCGHCPFGKVCNDASMTCVDDPCTFIECPKGEWCNPNDGRCEADACVGTACPDPTQVCKGGTCYDPSAFLPDAGIETHVTAGGGGCNTTSGGGDAGGLVALALALRRRKREARS